MQNLEKIIWMIVIILGVVFSVWILSVRFSHPDWTETELFLYMIGLFDGN